MWIFAFYVAGGILALLAVIDVIVLTSRAIKKRRAGRLKQEPAASGQPIDV